MGLFPEKKPAVVFIKYVKVVCGAIKSSFFGGGQQQEIMPWTDRNRM
jgi:hypothetical protein